MQDMTFAQSERSGSSYLTYKKRMKVKTKSVVIVYPIQQVLLQEKHRSLSLYEPLLRGRRAVRWQVLHLFPYYVTFKLHSIDVKEV